MTEPARRLLEHLRAELREPGLGYAELLTPIAGGYDTRIFAFRLSGAPEPFSIPLILRVLGSQHPPARALSERATQNAVVGLGYPAPRVLLASPDPTILGGAFLVMERLAGRPLLDAQRLGVASAPRMILSTSTPFMPGMSMSRMTKSGRARENAFIPSAPVKAVSIT